MTSVDPIPIGTSTVVPFFRHGRYTMALELFEVIDKSDCFLFKL